MLGKYLKSISIMGDENAASNGITEGQKLQICVVLSVPEDICTVSLVISDLRNSPLFALFDYNFRILKPRSNYATIDVDAGALPLLAGSYSIDFWLGDKGWDRIERINGALYFNVAHSSENKSNTITPHGSFYYNSEWRAVDHSDATHTLWECRRSRDNRK